jgi:hypothetical protein
MYRLPSASPPLKALWTACEGSSSARPNAASSSSNSNSGNNNNNNSNNNPADPVELVEELEEEWVGKGKGSSGPKSRSSQPSYEERRRRAKAACIGKAWCSRWELHDYAIKSRCVFLIGEEGKPYKIPRP